MALEPAAVAGFAGLAAEAWAGGAAPKEPAASDMEIARLELAALSTAPRSIAYSHPAIDPAPSGSPSARPRRGTRAGSPGPSPAAHSAPQPRLSIRASFRARPEGPGLSAALPFLPSALLSSLPGLAQLARAAQGERATSAAFEGAVLLVDVKNFSSLARSLVSAPDRLTATLRRYFSILVACFHVHGAEVLQYGGDAVLAFVPCRAGRPLGAAAAAAVRAAIEVRAIAFESDGFRLEAHQGIGVGQVDQYLLLAASGKAATLVYAGDAVAQACEAQALSRGTEVLLSPEASTLVQGIFPVEPVYPQERPDGFAGAAAPPARTAHRLDPAAFQGAASGSWAARRSRSGSGKMPLTLTNPCSCGTPLPAGERPPAARFPALVPYSDVLLALAPGAAAWGTADVGAVRPAFVVFAAFPELDLSRLQRLAQRLGGSGSDGALERKQATARHAARFGQVARAVHRLAAEWGGHCNKVFADEKGASALLGFGVAGSSHEDDAERAVRAALALQHWFAEGRAPFACGVAGGRVFAGALGSECRQEFGMIGDAVILASRLMCAARGEEEAGKATPETKTSGLMFIAAARPGGQAAQRTLCDEAVREAVLSLAASRAQHSAPLGLSPERRRPTVAFDALAPVTCKGFPHPLHVFCPRERGEGEGATASEADTASDSGAGTGPRPPRAPAQAASAASPDPDREAPRTPKTPKTPRSPLGAGAAGAGRDCDPAPPSPPPCRPRAAASGSGRRDEVAAARRALAGAAAARRGLTVVVEAEAGLGAPGPDQLPRPAPLADRDCLTGGAARPPARRAQEVQRECFQRGVTVLRTAAEATEILRPRPARFLLGPTEATPFWALRRLVRSIADASSRDAFCGRLEGRGLLSRDDASELWSGLFDEVRPDPSAAVLCSASHESGVLAPVTRILGQLVRALEAERAHAPVGDPDPPEGREGRPRSLELCPPAAVAVFCEDVQWLDPSSWFVLRQLRDACPRLVLVFSLRIQPEREPPVHVLVLLGYIAEASSPLDAAGADHDVDAPDSGRTGVQTSPRDPGAASAQGVSGSFLQLVSDVTPPPTNPFTSPTLGAAPAPDHGHHRPGSLAHMPSLDLGSGRGRRAGPGGSAPLVRLGTDPRRPFDVLHVRLGPLSPADSLELLTSVSSRAMIQWKQSDVDVVLQKAGGVPLFLVEIVRAASQAAGGGRTRRSSSIRASVDADVLVPDTVQQLHLANFDRLSPGAQQVARVDPAGLHWARAGEPLRALPHLERAGRRAYETLSLSQARTMMAGAGAAVEMLGLAGPGARFLPPELRAAAPVPLRGPPRAAPAPAPAPPSDADDEADGPEADRWSAGGSISGSSACWRAVPAEEAERWRLARLAALRTWAFAEFRLGRHSAASDLAVRPVQSEL
eukprot:tig00000194_g14823.t1